VFRDLMMARIIKPTSKLDSGRVLGEVGVDPVSYPTVNRRLRVYAKDSWRQRLSAACVAREGIIATRSSYASSSSPCQPPS
jgi:hypothetical protein